MDGVVELPAWIKNPYPGQFAALGGRRLLGYGEPEPEGRGRESKIEMPLGRGTKPGGHVRRRHLLYGKNLLLVLQIFHEGTQVILFPVSAKDAHLCCPNRIQADET